MKISINNFMGCEEAALQIDGISLLGGHNHQGKSSICRAVAAALSGDLLPAGINKGSAGLLVRTGAGRATVEIAASTGSVTATWPKVERLTEGQPPYASPVAVGTQSICNMSSKDRARFLTELLKAVPTKDDLNGEVADRDGITQAMVVNAWERIERDGWDQTHKHFQNKGREFKSQWNYVTGENYGTKKADAWVPAGWTESLLGGSEDGLQAIVTAARAELEDAVARQAVDEDQKSRMQEQVDCLDQRKSDFDEALKRSQDAEQYLETIQKTLAKLPRLNESEALFDCPHCDDKVELSRAEGRMILVKHEPVSDEILKTATNAISEAEKEVQQAKDELSSAQAGLNLAQGKLRQSEEALSKLDELNGIDSVSLEVVDAARQAVQKSEEELTAFKKKTEATRLSNETRINQIFVEALDPSGIRNQVLNSKMTDFRTRLEQICDDAGWHTVSVSNDMEVEMSERIYLLLSESEKYCCQVALQIAIAEHDGSQAVVIDGAEVLIGVDRSGLLQMLHMRKHHSLIGMSMKGAGSAPDLAAQNAGNCYWIKNGILIDVPCTDIGEI
jgi:hypothetical protein